MGIADPRIVHGVLYLPNKRKPSHMCLDYAVTCTELPFFRHAKALQCHALLEALLCSCLSVQASM